MREFNLLQDLPQSTEPRIVSPTTRTIKNRIIASEREGEFYDGDRNNGYGGYEYDGRWNPVAGRIIKEYNIENYDNILHVGSDKGFLLYELHNRNDNLYLNGIEVSDYAFDHTIDEAYHAIRKQDSFREIPSIDHVFDFIIAIGPVYSLSLPDAINLLKEIQRTGKGKSFITLGAFETEEEERLFRQWTLLGTTILSKDDWREVLEHVGYTGDYWFNTAKTLNLIEEYDRLSELHE